MRISTSFCLCFSLVDQDSEAQEREQLRYDRHKERERQRRLAKAHPDKRSKLDREKDRDVTEKIALGMPSKTATQESMFDQRLFNQSQVGRLHGTFLKLGALSCHFPMKHINPGSP